VTFELRGRKVWVAGEHGMVGSAIVRRIARDGVKLVSAPPRGVLDLRRQAAVEEWMAETRPEVVVLAAAKVGGIFANDTLPADFLYDNLAIEMNVMHAAHRVGVRKLLFLGSSCIYPRAAAQPMREDALLTGPLEPTNEWYAIAKIAGLKMCQAYRKQYGCDFISVMPANLFGPGDNFHPEHSHVPAALLDRFHHAAEAGAASVTVWGTGAPRREFLYVDDLADGCVFILKHYSDAAPINIGTGRDVTIAEFALLVAATVGYRGAIGFDASRPDGVPRKVMDVSRLAALGWTAPTMLTDALDAYFRWYLAHRDTLRQRGAAA
jgi:GDP-L-fucose synthase